MDSDYMQPIHRNSLGVDNYQLFSQWVAREEKHHSPQHAVHQDRSSQKNLNYETLVQNWMQRLEQHDPESSRHAHRTCDLFVRFSEIIQLTSNLYFIRWGALLHDVGKLFVPREILIKPGPLSADEWIVIRKHPEFARQIIGSIPFLQPVLEIPYYHHERWDGSGYPRGLNGDEIPFSARVFAVVDVWDALRSARPYWKAWDDQTALTYLAEQAGKLFDPAVVGAFVKNVRAFALVAA